MVRELSRSEVAGAVERWLACFGKHSDGIHADQYLWHVFSYERFPSVRAEAAKAAYALHEAHEYVILSNDRDRGWVTDIRPAQCPLSDWFVFPPNLAWTMAFTHEDGWLGPFFARHPDHERLNAENAAQIRKARETASARLKGWA